MEIKIKKLVIAALVYMYLPVLVFFAGWLKPAAAFLVSLATAAGLYLGIRLWYGEEEESIRVSGKLLIAAGIFILFMCFNTGIGGFTGQSGDWAKHNAVLHDMIDRPWPVIYSNAYGDSMLSYYIGQYLLPSLMGKLTGSFRAAELAMYMLAAAGLYLVWLVMLAVCRARGYKKQAMCLILLFFFGSLLILGQAVIGNLYPENFPYGSHEWMNPETVRLQYTTNWSLLKWVPGQAIVPWLATALLLLRPEKTETYVMIGIPVILFSGFAMLGLGIMMLALYICYAAGRQEGGRRKRFGRAFSLSNILLSISVGGTAILYFLGNLSGEKPEYLKLHLLNYGQKKIFYFIFCFFMFGYYAILLFKENRRNSVYWITIISLCIFPLFTMGKYNDFAMRTSIPALFTMLILNIRFIFYDTEGKERDSFLVRKTLLSAGLVIGMIYPMLNLREAVGSYETGKLGRLDVYGSLEQFSSPMDPEIEDDLKYNYYTYDLENDIFYRYLGR